MGYGQGQTWLQPVFMLGGMGGAAWGWAVWGWVAWGWVASGWAWVAWAWAGCGMARQTITEDRVPEGDVEVRRGEHVHATDGEIGRIHGFVIDPTDHGLTHIILDEGHLWGQKTVAIPISAIKDLNAGVRLSITKEDLKLEHRVPRRRGL